MLCDNPPEAVKVLREVLMAASCLELTTRVAMMGTPEAIQSAQRDYECGRTKDALLVIKLGHEFLNRADAHHPVCFRGSNTDCS